MLYHIHNKHDCCRSLFSHLVDSFYSRLFIHTLDTAAWIQCTLPTHQLVTFAVTPILDSMPMKRSSLWEMKKSMQSHLFNVSLMTAAVQAMIILAATSAKAQSIHQSVLLTCINGWQLIFTIHIQIEKRWNVWQQEVAFHVSKSIIGLPILVSASSRWMAIRLLLVVASMVRKAPLRSWILLAGKVGVWACYLFTLISSSRNIRLCLLGRLLRRLLVLLPCAMFLW